MPRRHAVLALIVAVCWALGAAERSDVLVIDNGGRSDEACIGDLVVLEARAAGYAILT